MPTRLALVVLALTLAALVCASSIWLLPAGQGPFSAVHGPTSPLLARRVAARVISCLSLMFVAALLAAPVDLFRASPMDQAFDSAPPSTDRLCLICTLNC